MRRSARDAWTSVVIVLLLLVAVQWWRAANFTYVITAIEWDPTAPPSERVRLRGARAFPARLDGRAGVHLDDFVIAQQDAERPGGAELVRALTASLPPVRGAAPAAAAELPPPARYAFTARLASGDRRIMYTGGVPRFAGAPPAARVLVRGLGRLRVN